MKPIPSILSQCLAAAQELEGATNKEGRIPGRILIVCLIGLLHGGCASVVTRELSAGEFVETAGKIGRTEGAPFPVYLGVGHQRAYLETWGKYRGLTSPRTIVYWTELDQLPDDLAARLKAGKNPWAPPEGGTL
jgi:hypothetical protein